MPELTIIKSDGKPGKSKFMTAEESKSHAAVLLRVLDELTAEPGQVLAEYFLYRLDYHQLAKKALEHKKPRQNYSPSLEIRHAADIEVYADAHNMFKDEGLSIINFKDAELFKAYRYAIHALILYDTTGLVVDRVPIIFKTCVKDLCTRNNGTTSIAALQIALDMFGAEYEDFNDPIRLKYRIADLLYTTGNGLELIGKALPRQALAHIPRRIYQIEPPKAGEPVYVESMTAIAVRQALEALPE